MFLAIVRHAPVWVWFLLPALVVLGLVQARTRQVRPAVAALMPLAFVGLSLAGVLGSLGRHPLALAAWAAGMALVVTATLAFDGWRGIRWLAAEHRFLVPGSWVPLAMILAIFVFRFALGAAIAISPAVVHEAGFVAVVGVLYGALSGVFAGRGLVMLELRNQATQPHAPPALAA